MQVTNHENNTKQRNQLALKIYIATKIGSSIRHNLDEKLQILQKSDLAAAMSMQKLSFQRELGQSHESSNEAAHFTAELSSDERHIKFGPGRSQRLPSDA